MEKITYDFTKLKFIQNSSILKKIYRVLKRNKFDNKNIVFFIKNILLFQ